MASLLINIDVPDLEAAIRFYTSALPLRVGRRFDSGFAELLDAPSPIYLLANKQGSKASACTDATRDYARHWCPVHLDFVVEDLDAACTQALAAGAKPETAARETAYGRIAVFADPFGHGFCLIEFNASGYDNLP